jgi:hypothetical protein
MVDYCTLGGSGTYGVAALRRSEIELAMHHWLFGLKALITEHVRPCGEQRCEGEGVRSRQPEQPLLPDCSWITRYRGTGVFRLRYGQISAILESARLSRRAGYLFILLQRYLPKDGLVRTYERSLNPIADNLQ